MIKELFIIASIGVTTSLCPVADTNSKSVDLAGIRIGISLDNHTYTDQYPVVARFSLTNISNDFIIVPSRLLVPEIVDPNVYSESGKKLIGRFLVAQPLPPDIFVFTRLSPNQRVEICMNLLDNYQFNSGKYSIKIVYLPDSLITKRIKRSVKKALKEDDGDSIFWLDHLPELEYKITIDGPEFTYVKNANVGDGDDEQSVSSLGSGK